MTENLSHLIKEIAIRPWAQCTTYCISMERTCKPWWQHILLEPINDIWGLKNPSFLFVSCLLFLFFIFVFIFYKITSDFIHIVQVSLEYLSPQYEFTWDKNLNANQRFSLNLELHKHAAWSTCGLTMQHFKLDIWCCFFRRWHVFLRS